MKTRIITYIFLILGLAACSDEFDMPVFEGIGEDGSIELTLSVPELQKIATRSGEGEVEKVAVLVFEGDEDTSVAKQIETFYSSDRTLSSDLKIRFILDKDLRSKSNLNLYFVANYNGELAENVTTISYLKGMREYSVVSDDGKVVMSAKAELATLFSSEVKLIRNAAYVTVTGGEEKNGSYVMTSTAYPFDVYGAALEGSLVAGVSTILGGISEISFKNDATDSSGKYYFPTKNEDYGCFMIVKAAYKDKDYFYRLDFQIQDKEDEDKIKMLNLEPNHWYQVMVKEVSGPGYATPEEASKNPTPYIEYEIHDHAPVIYNMISDGMRELGVSHEIVYSPVEGDESTMRTLYIKLYSKVDSSEEESFDIHNLSWDADWLEIGDLEEVKQSDEYPIEGGDPITIGGSSTGDNCNTVGTIYKCNVKFKTTSELGSLEDEITVTWKGLTRKVPVRWVREFKGNDLCNVTLTMYDANGNFQFGTSDYWDFLAGKEVNNPSVKLFGTGVQENNGKIRNEGLHFPVMYGDHGKANERRWYYTYEIKFTEASLISADYDWTLSVEGNPVIKDYVKVGMGSAENAVDQSISGTHSAGEDLLVFVTRVGNAFDEDGSDGTAKNDYTYGTGELVLTITPKESRTDSRLANRYSIDLYHTGFFHKSYEKHRVDEKDDVNYYYYEVVPIMGASRMRYWLDRNLGAKSAELYIQASDGSDYYGDRKAAGGYYKVAEYYENMFLDPKMYDDIAEEIYNIEERVSPPGYRVPKQKVWNALRNSPNFDTNSVGSYYNACYHTTIPGVDVFFPKARHMENGGMNGESRSGYYWTQTAASGTEKQEIGRWLKALCISGNSSSYVNGNVQTYAMSVRCINDISDDAQANRTYFNVSGATHVYLYTEDGSGNRTAVTNWPGQAIGDYQTMTNGWFNFSYESDNIDASQFYVIFNFVDKNGIIHTLSKSGDNPQNAEGWKVEGDSSNELKDSKELSIQGVPTMLGYWWQCNHETGSVYCYSDKPTPYKDPNSYRIYWQRYFNNDKANDFKYIAVINKNNTSDFTIYPANPIVVNGKEYYYYDYYGDIIQIQIVIRPYLDTWDGQTNDIKSFSFSSDRICTVVYEGWSSGKLNAHTEPNAPK